MELDREGWIDADTWLGYLIADSQLGAESTWAKLYDTAGPLNFDQAEGLAKLFNCQYEHQTFAIVPPAPLRTCLPATCRRRSAW